MIDSPTILITPPQPFASIRLNIHVSEIQKVMVPTLEEVRAAVKAQGMMASGPWFTHHFVRPTMTFDFEVCVPTASPIQAAGRVQPGLWAATKVARTIFHGDYAGLPAAWGELEKWLSTQPYRAGTEFWECYNVNPEDSPNREDWRTELNWPLLD